jgi:ADP-heptose:LPS heptosyltransferase
VIQFKYLGDAVFLTPALKQIKDFYPQAEIHVLTAAEIAPIFSNLSHVKKVWAMPRTRGQFNLLSLWPHIKKLRKNIFDLILDFGGNDRGALFTFFLKGKEKYVLVDSRIKISHKYIYTKFIHLESDNLNNVLKNLKFLNALNIFGNSNIKLEIVPNKNLFKPAKLILKNHPVIFHIGTSQPKKEWPLSYWFELYQLLNKQGIKVAFSAGHNLREQMLLNQLIKMDSKIYTMPSIKDLDLYLAVLKQSMLIISGDTAPLHFGRALGVDVIGLFGTQDSIIKASPIYQVKNKLLGVPCVCLGPLAHRDTCNNNNLCMRGISPKRVAHLVEFHLKKSP